MSLVLCDHEEFGHPTAYKTAALEILALRQGAHRRSTLTGTAYLPTQLHRSMFPMCELRVKFHIISPPNSTGPPVGVTRLNLRNLDVLSLHFKPEAPG
jgi:hypothetical protein